MPRAKAEDAAVARAGEVHRNGQSPRSSEVRARLSQAEERLQAHARALRRELTLQDVTVAGAPLMDHVRRHPVLACVAAAGLAGALVFSYRLATRPSPPDERRDLRALVAAALDEGAGWVVPGGDPEVALRRALRKRGPVIIIEERAAERTRSDSLIRIALKTLVSTAVGFGVKLALENAARTRTADEASAAR